MHNTEFSNSFDVLLNSYSINTSFGEESLNEYEKSLYLTRAQEEIALSLYNGKNPFGESFESTEEIRRYLAALVKTDIEEPITTSNGLPLGNESMSKFFSLPEDVWFIIYESVNVTKGDCGDVSLSVYPATHDEYNKIKNNPFRGANGRRALRFDLSEGNVEIISKYPINTYYVRYLRKLNPIVLIDLSDGQKVGDTSSASECELPEALHYHILERAVMLALQDRGYTNSNSNK